MPNTSLVAGLQDEGIIDTEAIDWQFDEAANQWFDPNTGEFYQGEINDPEYDPDAPVDPNAPPVYAGYEDWGYDPATGAHIDPQVCDELLPCMIQLNNVSRRLVRTSISALGTISTQRQGDSLHRSVVRCVMSDTFWLLCLE